MNDDLNELETELRGFRPAPASPDLRDRVARNMDLADDVQPARHDHRQHGARLAWLAAAAIILVAAGLAWLHIQGSRNDQQPGPQPPPRIAVQDPPCADIQTPPRPTQRAYQLAAADSPERLDALLDQHAVLLLPPSPNLDLSGVLAP